MTSRSQKYLFTLNNYTELEYEVCCNLDIRYLVIGKEVGSEGTPHLQGFCYFKTKKSFKQCIKLIPRAHITIANGSVQANYDYCSKDGDFIEKGERPHVGKRNDLHFVRDSVKNGIKTIDIIENDQFDLNYQSLKCLQLLKSIYSRPRMEKPTVLWFYGSTGCGKTKKVYDTFSDVYSKDESSWWCGYEQQKVILIDDYRCDFMKFHSLLKLLDRYPDQRQIKGSCVQINSSFIILTSPKHPYLMWNHRTEEDIRQLMRRIDGVINVDLLNGIRNVK
jgi:hypothetical protein